MPRERWRCPAARSAQVRSALIPMRCCILLACSLLIQPLFAGGPRLIAGSTYFDPAQVGQPVVWAGGIVRYFTDQGALSNTVTNAQANAMVAAAADAWNAVPTAAVRIIAAGNLAEDVSSRNIVVSSTGITLPADTESTAVTLPLAVIYDADGSIIDSLYGVDASDPDDCIGTGATSFVDNLLPAGTIAHAWILLNGRCTGTAAQLQQLQFQTTRAFGRVLGLDWSQANDAVLFSPAAPSLQQLQGWPLMRPIDLYCNQLSVQCIPQALQLRPDDVAAVSRLYPVTSANLAFFPTKQLTAAKTISIHGNVYFRHGEGMQGVNLVARPIDPASLQPEDQYATAAVSGSLFTGNRGNPVTGTDDSTGHPLSDFGSDDLHLQGSYDLSGLLLPPGRAAADYQLTLEAVNPLYTGASAVGPYMAGSPTPSGTLPVLILHGLAAGASVQQDITVEDSAGDLQDAASSDFAAPSAITRAGEWAGRLAMPALTAWFAMPVLAGRHFTFEAQAIDEAGSSAETKLRPALGVWNASAGSADAPADFTIAAFNGASPGTSALGIDSVSDGELILAIADERGDGRPDYAYRGRLLYADTVAPSHLPTAGGHIRIEGSGFRPGMTVQLGTNITAIVDQLSSNFILASVPPSATTGSLDLVLRDPATNSIAVIAGGISYGAASADTLTLIAALPSLLSIGAAAPWTVRVLGPNQVTPVGGVNVSFSILAGSGTFSACFSPCSVVTSGDGYATASFSPGAAVAIHLQAALPGGSTLAATLTGVAAPALAPVTNAVFLAPGAALSWNARVTATANGQAVRNAAITWQGSQALAGQAGISLTDTTGVTNYAFTLGPWAAGTSAGISACLAGSPCTSIAIFVVHPESENLVAVSGLDQSLQLGDSPAAVIVRLVTPASQPIIGGDVRFFQTARQFAPPCTGHGQCGQGRSLGALSQTIASDLNGLASFSPALPANLPVTITGLAGAGAAATLPFSLNVYP